MIYSFDYDLINKNIPVQTVKSDGSFSYTDCCLCDFHIDNKNFDNNSSIKEICKNFAFDKTIITELKHQPIVHYNATPKFFALTTANAMAHTFYIPKDILAIAFFWTRDTSQPVWLECFEVNESFRYYATSKKFTHVGTTAISALKDVYKNQGILGEAMAGVVPFWLKNNFKVINGLVLGWDAQR